MLSVSERLSSLGIDLESVVYRPPRGNYVLSVKTGNLIHLAGHIPYNSEGQPLCGLIGNVSNSLNADKVVVFDIKEGYQIARNIAISMIKSLQVELQGDLDRVQRIVKMNGLIRANSGEFSRHPEIINGASDLFVEVFGEEKGIHARCAYGVHSLPCGVPIEIDLIVEII